MCLRRLGIVLVFCVIGCGSGGPPGPKLYPVSGILTVGGKPVPDVGVQLIPVEPKAASKASNIEATYTSTGITGADGKFVMTASNGQKGAAKGKYYVLLVYTPKLSPEEWSNIALKKEKAEFTPPFPKEYLQTKTTPKKLEVVDKAAELELKL